MKPDVNNVNHTIILEALTADQGDQIELSIYNNGEETIICGLDYEIQIYKINRGKEYPYEIAVNAIGIEIKPDKSYVQIIKLNNFHYQITALPSAFGR